MLENCRFEGFIKNKGQPGYTYIVLGKDMPYLIKMYCDSKKYLSETDFIEILKILIGNIIVAIDAHVCLTILQWVHTVLHSSSFEAGIAQLPLNKKTKCS